MDERDEQIKVLQAQVAELLEWKAEKTLRQISYPLDIASRNALGTVTRSRSGSTTKTETLLLTGNAQSINVPAPYVGSEVLLINGAEREIPYIA